MESEDKIVKKKDFVEMKYTGTANDQIFDSNIESDLKQVNPEAKAKETIVIVGEGMVVPGLDEDIEGKEIGKDYEITISPRDGFGERRRELMKTIPLNIFTEKKINPRPGMVLNMDGTLAKIITISGARVITDFNNPLAGKELHYKYKIVRKVDDEKERAKTVLELLFKFVPDFELKDDAVIVKGPKGIGPYVDSVKDKFKELLGKELKFEEEKEEDKKDESVEGKEA